MFSKTTFQKTIKFGYYMNFPLFSFLEEKPLDFICALQKGGICLPIVSSSIKKSEMSMLLNEYDIST